MSILSVFHNTDPHQPYKVLTHADDIRTTLAEHGLNYSPAGIASPPRLGTGREAALQALGEQVGQWLDAQRCQTFTVIDVDGDTEANLWLADEHRYACDEVFVVVSGRAQLNVRCGDWVCALLGEKGDVLRVPQGAGRWLSLGDRPFCLALRLLEKEGVLPVFEETSTAKEFPGMDEL
ncbi:hypothetical protein [Pseudomonas cremoricolorata]|uniref:Acireductone dioxygenase n=1 Tax=Pseudomonas cremoricolorata TaxID=157783 RepID=A0A089WRY1_9PSED|nr:hypothetical protein [Pseudomonas cremoricolorata]AIR89934.1 hypothetical protein LK03_11800 [Pseudomonas cremoricolorata]